MKAKDISLMDPGTRFEMGGQTYIRLLDYEDYHVKEWIANINSGWCGLWYSLNLEDDPIKVLD